MNRRYIRLIWCLLILFSFGKEAYSIDFLHPNKNIQSIERQIMDSLLNVYTRRFIIEIPKIIMSEEGDIFIAKIDSALMNISLMQSNKAKYIGIHITQISEDDNDFVVWVLTSPESLTMTRNPNQNKIGYFERDARIWTIWGDISEKVYQNLIKEILKDKREFTGSIQLDDNSTEYLFMYKNKILFCPNYK